MRVAGLALLVILTTFEVRGDGMVVPERFAPKVEIPSQQALIHFADGMERLVIETSFLGAGTNFAWVVPLPATPQIQPVSETFFTSLQRAFRPNLVHQVHPYYQGFLVLAGLAYLAWRAMKDEVFWTADLPLCLVLGAGAWYMGGHVAVGIIAVVIAVYVRLFSRSNANLAVVVLAGLGLSFYLSLVPYSARYVGTLGGETTAKTVAVEGVTVVAAQRAGVFDVTTLRGSSSAGVMEWLAKNGYQTPAAAEPAVRHYLAAGWVLAAAKVRRDREDRDTAALHPLAFTFPTQTPVYPTRLTAVDNGDCTMDLYVFGKRRASASHFRSIRCDHLADRSNPKPQLDPPGLRLSDQELLPWIGDATVGTKLSARLSPAQMAYDVEIKWGFYWPTGNTVYSDQGARMVALNVAVPLAGLGWLLASAMQGGWKVDRRTVQRWRWRLTAMAFSVGLVIFLGLTKVEVVSIR